MTNLLEPKVSIAEIAGASASPKENLVVLGIVGVSETGTANTVYEINSVSQADTLFGTNYSHGADLVPMIRTAFKQGASLVKAVSVGQPTIDSATSGSQGALTADAQAGASAVTVADATIYSPGDIVYLGTNKTYDKEERLEVLTGVSTTLTFTTALKFDHYTGEDAKIITPKTSTNYADAINALEEDEDKGLVISDLNDDDTADLIITMCANSLQNYNAPCCYIRPPEIGDAVNDVITRAEGHNNNRVFCFWPFLVEYTGRVASPGVCAAALAGVIAGNGVPKLNHNFSVFSGFGNVTDKITDMDALITGGVTPIELKSGTIHIVRFVTTETIQDGVPTTKWREGAIRLNVDYMERDIANAIQAKFMQKGNTPQTRLAIKTEIKSKLDIYKANNIIIADDVRGEPAYRDPVVAVNPNDATQVDVDIEVSPGKPLNFINLNFKVVL